ncbi:MAG TPA: hypothetical protein VGB13_05345, partial [Candidatus Krumholzibacteria bacterium]
MAADRRFVEALWIGLMLLLTALTAYIHYWVGGWLLIINAAGYAGLIVLVLGSWALYRRALPVVLGLLAAYAGATIAGWVVMGPYFDVAYLAKGIELLLIATIALWLRFHAAETRDALR